MKLDGGGPLESRLDQNRGPLPNGNYSLGRLESMLLPETRPPCPRLLL